MKTHPNAMRWAGLLVLVVWTVVGTAQAQSSARGSFTLPFEVEWRGETVPAGHYAFEVQPAIPQPIVIVRDIEHPREIRLIGSAAAVAKAPLRNSTLGILAVDGRRYIHTLDLSAIGASFIYTTPKPARAVWPSAKEVSRIAVAGEQQEP